jgi:hypothetical protein
LLKAKIPIVLWYNLVMDQPVQNPANSNLEYPLKINFFVFLKSLRLLGYKPFRKSAKAAAGGFFKYYLFPQYRNSIRPVLVALPIDSKIPTVSGAAKDYNSHISLFGACSLWAKLNLGPAALNDISQIFNEFLFYFQKGAEVFKAVPTTCGRSGNPGIAMRVIRLVDKDLNAAPSLHIAVAASWYLGFIALLDQNSQGGQIYDNIKEQLFWQTVKIFESTLLTKQHCVIDIALGLALVSKHNPALTEKTAGEIIEAMFAADNYGMNPAVVNEIRETILKNYNKILDTSVANNDKDGTVTMVDYLKTLANN